MLVRPLIFSGTATDVDGYLVAYHWDFDGDGEFDWFSDSTARTLHKYPSEGTYNARLRVINNAGNAAETTVQVAVGRPRY